MPRRARASPRRGLQRRHRHQQLQPVLLRRPGRRQPLPLRPGPRGEGPSRRHRARREALCAWALSPASWWTWPDGAPPSATTAATRDSSCSLLTGWHLRPLRRAFAPGTWPSGHSHQRSRRRRALFLSWCSSIRLRMSSRTRIASTMWGPLLSMTHSARSPIAASVISARDGAPVRASVVEHLRRPDHRDVRGLAEPEDLLLDLGEPLVAALHGEVAAGDHDADRRAAHRGEEQVREHLEAAPGLDLEDDAEVAGGRGCAGRPCSSMMSSVRCANDRPTRWACRAMKRRSSRSLLRQRRQPEVACPAG